MRKYFIFFMIYSFLGFLLERVINVIFLGFYFDNSVLVGPYQPLYGLGIILAVIIFDKYLIRINQRLLRYSSLIIVAIITTGFSEFIHGEAYEFLTGLNLWDYNMTFSCSYPYVCALPTSLFGILSGLTVLLIHPIFQKGMDKLNNSYIMWIFGILLSILIIDSIYTFIFTDLITTI